MRRPEGLILVCSCQRDKFLRVTVNTSDDCSVSRSLLFTTCPSLKDNLSSLVEEGLECDLRPFSADSRRKRRRRLQRLGPPSGFHWSPGTSSVDQRRGPRWVSGTLYRTQEPQEGVPRNVNFHFRFQMEHPIIQMKFPLNPKGRFLIPRLKCLPLFAFSIPTARVGVSPNELVHERFCVTRLPASQSSVKSIKTRLWSKEEI